MSKIVPQQGLEYIPTTGTGRDHAVEVAKVINERHEAGHVVVAISQVSYPIRVRVDERIVVDDREWHTTLIFREYT